MALLYCGLPGELPALYSRGWCRSDAGVVCCSVYTTYMAAAVLVGMREIRVNTMNMADPVRSLRYVFFSYKALMKK